MDELFNRLEKFLQEKVTQGRTVNGGDIAQASIIETSSGKKYFFKTAMKKGLFTAEANGLKELSKAKVFRIPEVIYADEDCLLLEWIDTGHKDTTFYRRFGQQLARMHRHTAENFGFQEDNFIGATPQVNIPNEKEKNNWTEFYWNKRLLYQFKLVEEKGYNTEKLTQGFSKLENKIEGILKDGNETPTLLHGDLWGGNYIVANDHEAILIDPAVYYGHREADIAMTRLFGGFTKEFYQAYEEENPLPDGADYRLNVYLLYHVLNHLNLFGTSYLKQAERLVTSY